MFKEVCGHFFFITLTTHLVVLLYLRFLCPVGSEEETQIPHIQSEIHCHCSTKTVK